MSHSRRDRGQKFVFQMKKLVVCVKWKQIDSCLPIELMPHEANAISVNEKKIVYMKDESNQNLDDLNKLYECDKSLFNVSVNRLFHNWIPRSENISKTEYFFKGSCWTGILKHIYVL